MSAVRYAFLAALPAAVAGGLFLAKVMRINRLPQVMPKIVFFILFLIALNGISFASETKPPMSEEWYNAMVFLKSQKPGGVLTWWEYGSWVQGIAGFPTLVDSVAGQDSRKIEEIASFLLEKNISSIEKYKVDYIVIPTDMILQMTNIAALLNLDVMEYQYLISKYTGRTETADAYGKMYVLDGRAVVYEQNGRLFGIKRVYWRAGGNLIAREYDFDIPTMEGAVYISNNELQIIDFPYKNFIIYIPPKLEDTLLTRLLLFGKDFENYKIIYSNPAVKIYRVVK